MRGIKKRPAALSTVDELAEVGRFESDQIPDLHGPEAVRLPELVDFPDRDAKNEGGLFLREQTGKAGEVFGFHWKKFSSGIPVALETLIALSIPSRRRPARICESSEGDMPISLANSIFLIFLSLRIFFRGFIWLPANYNSLKLAICQAFFLNISHSPTRLK